MEKIEGKIIYTDNSQTNYVNGAFGSINQNGDFIINFFFEQPDNISNFTINFDENNIPNQIFNDNGIVKTVLSKIVLNVNTAKSIAQWINTNIEAYENNPESNEKK